MDPFAFFENREIDLEDLFSVNNNKENDISHLFRKLGHCMDKKSNIWWDRSTMEKYLKDGLIPRKLRWDVPINDGLLGEEDIDEWYAFFIGKGREIMEFLLKRKQCKLTLVENQIKEIRDKLIPFINTPEYNKLMDDLHKNMQKKDVENKNIKKKKYTRDFEDYQNKRVFRWQSTLAATTTASIPPQTTTGSTSDMRPSQPQGQQQQQQPRTKPTNGGQIPHRQDDKQPYTPRRQPLRKPYFDQHQRSNYGVSNAQNPR